MAKDISRNKNEKEQNAQFFVLYKLKSIMPIIKKQKGTYKRMLQRKMAVTIQSQMWDKLDT